jgi:hypothetical protein
MAKRSHATKIAKDFIIIEKHSSTSGATASKLE